jgi:antitoxin PrlF
VKVRELVEAELENLQLGVQIAKLRAAENLSQTKLAAKAEMSAPKISAMENEPRNLTIGTLIRVAHALGSRSKNWKIENRNSKLGKNLARRRGGGAMAEEKLKPAAFEPKAAAPGVRVRKAGRRAMKKQAKMTSKGRITVPREIRRRLGVRAGDKLEFEDTGDGVRVKVVQKESVFEKYRGIGNPGIGKGRKAIQKWLREIRGHEDGE